MSFLDRVFNRHPRLTLPPALHHMAADGSLTPLSGPGARNLGDWQRRAARATFQQNLINSLTADYTTISNDLLARAYIQSVTASACIELNAQSMSNIPVAVRNRNDEIIESEEAHPLTQFTGKTEELLWLISASQDVWGRAYLRKRKNEYGVFSTLEWLWPTEVEPVKRWTRGGKPVIVEYRVYSETIPKYEIIDLKLFDPTDPTGAVSPLERVITQVGISRNMAVFTANFFFNGAQLAGILKSPNASSNEELRQRLREFVTAHGGARNAFKPMGTTDADADFIPTSTPPADLAMSDLSGITESAIAMAFGVNPALIGLTDAGDALSSQNTYQAIQANHVRAHTLPRLARNLNQINREWTWCDFTPLREYTLIADVDAMELLSPVTQDNVMSTTALYAGGTITLNESRDRLGYPPLDGNNGDVVLVSGLIYPSDQLQEVATLNVSGGEFAFGNMPALPFVPPSTPASGVDSSIAGQLTGEPLNGTQLQAAQNALMAMASGTLAPDAVMGLLLSAGIALDVAKQMVDAQAAQVISAEVVEVETAKQLPATALSSQLKELDNWRKKIDRSTPDAPFYFDALADHPAAAWLRSALENREDVDTSFWVARAWMETDKAPPIRQDELAEAAPEKANEYWRGYDELRADIGEEWLGYMSAIESAAIEGIKDNPERADIEAVLDTDELIAVWLGTPENPGTISRIFIGGMAAGINAINEGVTTDPRSIRQEVAFDLMSEEAWTFVQSYVSDLLDGINQTTIKEIQKIIADWIESGEHLDVLIAQLTPVFNNRRRAKKIATTESTRAYNEGAFNRYEAAGITEARWQTVNVGRNRQHKEPGDVCHICSPLHRQIGNFREGWVHPGGRGEEAMFKGKRYIQPAHSNCRCFSSPVL